MSFLMSAVVTARNLGFHSGFIKAWFSAWPAAFVIGTPIIFLVVPLTGRLVKTVDRIITRGLQPRAFFQLKS
jgi:hypothetical protein